MSYIDEYVPAQPEHECPVPLEYRVDAMDTGGMFFSPAGRWETITALTSPSLATTRISTDRTGDGYGWVFWPSDKMPYLPFHRVDGTRYVVVAEYGGTIEARIADDVRTHARGHVLVSAHMVRGDGWHISDRPGGGEVEQVTKPSKGTARAEVNRRARAHAKALGLPLRKAGDAR